MNYLVLWSEWDIGEHNKLFASKEAGLKWLQNNTVVAELAAEDEMPVDDAIQLYFADGLMTWQTLELIE